jgi:hypothetical protein
VRVLRDGPITDVHIGEVSVFEEVDRVERLDLGVQAQRGDDLPRRQAEQLDPRPGHRDGMQPAPESVLRVATLPE